MKEYKATSAVTISTGSVILNADQARRRTRNIKPLGDGIFEVINPIQFKSGETFSSDIEVNKSMAVTLDTGSHIDEVNTVKDDEADFMTKADLQAELDGKGITYDKRWGETRLIELLESHDASE